MFVLYFVCSSIGDCRQQDEELDELSASVERMGGVGLTIHEELLAQVRFFNVLDNTSTTILKKMTVAVL